MRLPNSAGRRWLAKLMSRENKTANQRKAIRYYTALFQATPPWLNERHKSEMRRIYREAHVRGLAVDHIVPLRSPLVCGLHVPWNLQPLPEKANDKKSNKWWPGAPFEQPGFEFEKQISLF